MSKLVFYKQYLHDIFSERYKLGEVTKHVVSLPKRRPRTTLSTFWLIYLSAYVNELASDTAPKEEMKSITIATIPSYHANQFIGLTLTLSSVGELPAEVNYYYQTRPTPVLETAKRVFASYMVLLGVNQRQMNRSFTAPPRERLEIIANCRSM